MFIAFTLVLANLSSVLIVSMNLNMFSSVPLTGSISETTEQGTAPSAVAAGFGKARELRTTLQSSAISNKYSPYSMLSTDSGEGKATIQELAGVTGQREKAVQIGLEWLAAGGHISIESQDGTVQLSKGKGDVNPYLQKEFFIAVRGILEETVAYRLHFTRANSESLFDLSIY